MKTVEQLEQENLVLAAQVAKMREAIELCVRRDDQGCWGDDIVPKSVRILLQELDTTTTEQFVSAAIALAETDVDSGGYGSGHDAYVAYLTAKSAYEKGSK